MGLNEDLVKEWVSHDSFVFLLNQNIENDDGEISSHYSVVTVEKAKDGWWGVVTANDAYESLNENIWKETVQFVVKQLGVTNRSNVVFHNPSSRRKPTTSPYKWFAKTNAIPDDGKYDDDYSCGPYCCNFLLDHFRTLGRIDCNIIPEYTSELIRLRTKSRMIPVLLNLMKPLAETSCFDESALNAYEAKPNWEIHNKVCSIGGEGSDESFHARYKVGPEKYSMRNLNLSMLSLPCEVISDLILESGCPCERQQYSGAPRIQCSSCYMVYHIECFFAFVKYVRGEKITCHRCKKEVGRDTDMLLIPPRCQVPILWSDYVNDGVLVLDFLRCDRWSTLERTKIRKKCINYFERRYGKTWVFVSPYTKNIKETANDSESNEEPNEISTAKPTPVDKETSDESNEEGRDTLVESDFPRCSWSNSSKGCLLPGVEPKDVCGVDGCQTVFHHLCQTEWEIYQYHLENPNGDTRFCSYDSDGKKRCIHHHAHSKLALTKVLPDNAGVDTEKTSLVAISTKDSLSQSTIIPKLNINTHHLAEQKQALLLNSHPTTASNAGISNAPPVSMITFFMF